MKAYIYFIVVALILAVSACTQPVEVQGPPGYDLSKPEVFKLPGALQEISGIAFRNGNADTVYAEQDEEGRLYYMHLGDKEANTIKFGKKGDYEDIGIYNDTIVMLRSDGALFMFSLKEISSGEATNVTELKDLVSAGEYEAMYVDDNRGSVYVLCKDCPGTKKEKKIPGYEIMISPIGEVTATNFSIDEKGIEDINGGKKINLKASAMAKNRITGEWYILSAVNKILVVADKNWIVKNIYPLSPSSLFTQPEGIAFDKNNNLYISNEGEGIVAGTVLKFAYQNK